MVKKMKKILIASTDFNKFKKIEDVFTAKGEYSISKSETGKDTLEKIREDYYTLAVLDEKLPDSTGEKLAEEIIKINAMTNTTLVSDLSDHDFHEATEGLGILMKLPKVIDEEKAQELEEYLDYIVNP